MKKYIYSFIVLFILLSSFSTKAQWPFPDGAGIYNITIPRPDGIATATGTVSSFTFTLTTTQPNDWIGIWVSGSPNLSAVVSGISSANTTGWNSRSLGFFNAGGSADILGEMWYGRATGILTSEVITVNLSSGGNEIAAVAIGFSGFQSGITCPFDSNGALPSVNSGPQATIPNGTISTSNRHNYLLFANFVSGSANQVLSGYTELQYVNNGPVQIVVLGQPTTLPQSSVTNTMGNTNANPWVTISDSWTSELNGGTCPP